jgi:hypothetical protein
MNITDQMRRLADDKDALWPGLMSTVQASGYLQGLTKEVERLSLKFETGRPPKPPIDPEEVWAKFRKEHYTLETLNARELRSLCVSPLTAVRKQLIEALQANSESLSRISNINGIVHAYFTHWRTCENPESVEELLLKTLRSPSLAKRSRVLRRWNISKFLFSPNAASMIGQEISRKDKSPKEVVSSYFVDATTRLASKSKELAVGSIVARMIHTEKAILEANALSEFAWLQRHLFTEDLDAGSYRTAIASLIESELPVRFVLFQQAITQEVYANARLGDPRLSGCAANWRLVSPEAKARFLSWLAKETLQFFFDTIVPANDENRRRAEFWKHFAKTHGKIRDFQVAVSSEDIGKIQRSRAKLIPAYARISGTRSTSSSAFLIVFKGYNDIEYVVVEFSETGYAAQIYRRDVFEAAGVKLRATSFRQKEDLRRLDQTEDRILHMGAWEFRAFQLLARLGIRP